MVKFLKLNVKSILVTRNIAITFNFEKAQLKKLAYLYRYNKTPCFPRIINYFLWLRRASWYHQSPSFPKDALYINLINH